MKEFVPYVMLIIVMGNLGVQGQEWLGTDSENIDIENYFQDPFFYPLISAERTSYESQYYPYFGEDFFGNDYGHSPEAISKQRQKFESPFYPYFGERFLGWAENYSTSRIQYIFPTNGDTLVTVVSQRMKGYQVYLDGVPIGTEGTLGDLLDGKFDFLVIGNRNHEIDVFDGQFNYPKKIYFQKGVPKIIYIEPASIAYNN